MAVWLLVKITIPPDDYISPAIASAAFKFIDIWNLEQPAFLVVLATFVSYTVVALLLRPIDPARAHLYAAGICALALAIYWLRFDGWLLAEARYQLRTILLIATPILGLFAAVHAMRDEDRRQSPFTVLGPLASALESRLTPQLFAGALTLMMLIHAIETTKFLRSWVDYKAAVRSLATGTDSDPALGDPLFVSSKRIGGNLSRLAWNSTTPYLSVLVAPALAPTRLVVDPDTGYFWLSCKTATTTEQTSTAIPLQARQLIRLYSCLHRS
jgi:hypothetical protein